RISQANLHHGSDYTPYEGIEVTGWPVTMILRGKTIVRDGRLEAAAKAGEHIARERSAFASHPTTDA
ncbi:hypothetical protein ACP3WN_25050, partial [Salmonella enterica]